MEDQKFDTNLLKEILEVITYNKSVLNWLIPEISRIIINQNPLPDETEESHAKRMSERTMRNVSRISDDAKDQYERILKKYNL